MTSWSWNAKYTDSKRAEILVLGPGLLGFNLCDTRLHPLANYFLGHQRIEPEADWEVPEFGLSGCTTDTFPPFTTRNPRGVSQWVGEMELVTRAQLEVAKRTQFANSENSRSSFLFHNRRSIQSRNRMWASLSQPLLIPSQGSTAFRVWGNKALDAPGSSSWASEAGQKCRIENCICKPSMRKRSSN